jgi:CheY-like chemotaxis protein
VRLTVADTGAGMTADVRERAFEPFFTTKGPQQGTGLGLSTVYGIVQQHDGLLHLRSQPGEGTTFEIYLPEGARRAAPSAGEITAPAPRGRETILLAEDEDHVRRAVLRILGGAGYRTLAAANGLEAVRLLRDQTEPVHLALLDLVMPEQGGPETWEQLRALRPDLRVLFASGYADQRHRDRLPADADVIEKPFRAAELLRLIRAKLDGSAT